MTKELFTKMILEIQNFSNRVDQLCDVLCTDFFESPLVDSGWNLINLLVESHFDEEGQDWVNWWLYEKDGNPELKAWDENDNEIPTETIDDLWNLVKDHVCTI
jgi:hypothetical protein